MAVRQAIIWTNDDPIHWLVYAAFGGEELICFIFTFRQWWINQGSILENIEPHIDIYTNHIDDLGCWSIYLCPNVTIIVERHCS